MSKFNVGDTIVITETSLMSDGLLKTGDVALLVEKDHQGRWFAESPLWVGGRCVGDDESSYCSFERINADVSPEVMRQALTLPYNEFVMRLCKDGDDILEQMDGQDAHNWHMASCIMGEAGELFDVIKAAIIYRKPLDRKHAIEELGDLKFYITGLIESLQITEQEFETANRVKLSKRYSKLCFSNEDAQNRADKA